MSVYTWESLAAWRGRRHGERRKDDRQENRRNKEGLEECRPARPAPAFSIFFSLIFFSLILSARLRMMKERKMVERKMESDRSNFVTKRSYFCPHLSVKDARIDTHKT
jgi:hypothetical protein